MEIMLTCNHKIVIYLLHDDIEYWLNDALEKTNMTSDSSENECKCRALIEDFLKLGGTYCIKKRTLI